MEKTARYRQWLFSLMAAALFGLAPIAIAVAGDVWVNTNSGVYHCPGTRYYANTKRGTIMSESAAVTRGYRAAYGTPCSPDAANRARAAAIQSLTPVQNGHSVKVWINSNSHVYHCPGTRYYGATKRGSYASEAEAIAGGNRPAYGQRCL